MKGQSAASSASGCASVTVVGLKPAFSCIKFHRYIRKKTQHYVSEGVCLYLNVTDGIERYVVKYLNRMYSNLSVTIFERIRIFPELPVFIRI